MWIPVLLGCLAYLGCAGGMQSLTQEEKSSPSQRQILEPLRALAQLFLVGSPTDAFKAFGPGLCISLSNPIDLALQNAAWSELNRTAIHVPLMLHVADRTHEKGEQQTNVEIKDSSDADDLKALQKRSKKGGWYEVLRLLEKMEASPNGAPIRAYHFALSAFSGKEKRELVEQVLERMGDKVDTKAYNELLHVLSLRNEYDALMRAWEQMDRNDPQRSPDVFSYQKVLQLCASQGRWKKSFELLEELERDLGAEAMHAGHYIAVVRACIADHRFDEAVSVASKIPVGVLESNDLLCQRALVACAEAGAPELAARLARILCSKPSKSAKACLEFRTQSLMACRRANCIKSVRAAWEELDRADSSPSALSFAVMVGALFDAADAQAELAAECVQEALDLVKRAFAELPAPAARVVLNGALTCTLDYAMVAPARQILLLLDSAHPDLLYSGIQLRILDFCATNSDWDALISEVALARERIKPAWAAEMKERKDEFSSVQIVHHADSYLVQTLQTVREAIAAGDKRASAALVELEAFAADVASLPEVLDVSGIHNESMSSEMDDKALADYNFMQRQYSKSIKIAPDYSEPLDVLYEDGDLLAISKPAGVSSCPAHRTSTDSMVNRAIAHLEGGTPHVLHRLDWGTSGTLLFAKNVLAAREVAEQFRARKTEKSYLALLLGSPEADSFECALRIAKHPVNRDMSAVVRPEDLLDEEADAAVTVKRGMHEVHPEDVNGNPAQSAHTRFEVLARGTHATACLVRPVTGRMHQIRVHAEALGHPLAGDEQYGLDMQPTELNCSRMLLHAYELCVVHPTRRERMCFKSPLPEIFIESAVLLGVPEEALRAL